MMWITSHHRRRRSAAFCTASVIGAGLVLLLTLAWPCGVLQAAPASPPAKMATDRPRNAEEQARRAQQRTAGIAKLATRVQVGLGSVVADIGAGGGQDTWRWAAIVGSRGTVYAEEVTEKQVAALKTEAEKRKLAQVRPVLGRDDEPALPPNTVDLAYLRLVYHHLSQPRPMLRGIWRSLKPGGYLIVIDRHRGTLRDWVPREQRTAKHFWIAETTVVREAREEGFRFVACAEDCCELPEPFVLIFQRPQEPLQPGHDPDPFLPLAVERVTASLLPPAARFQHPVFIALGQARQLIAPLLKRSAGPGLEIVLEEWATEKQERPALPAGVSLPSVLTQDGDPQLDRRPIDAVFFLDSYHLLFHGPTLLRKLREQLTADGRVFVMDREAGHPQSRREASHRRRIDPTTVKREMAAAGFALRFEAPRPAADRFLLVFGKADVGP
jgi:predicted methyltransferase